MNTQEAYEITLKKIKELSDYGIKVTIKNSISKDDKELIKKYSGEERILPKYWVHVTFELKNKKQSIKLVETKNYLHNLGISFDTVGWANNRDWELDWSFEFTRDFDDIDFIVNEEIIENILDNCEKQCKSNCNGCCDI